ncbi:hypothetical protein RSA42_12685 [Exiguobacterium indicum]|uniref:hypothetical protein n=1 Tax=Exiguobacterium indicum TaxID=296995 RepID=UPI000736547E|nr:hypothetical protein [Exiguobacterium indicum]KTR59205.1 hypothetical protein RSA42_12685 [Exiguobacterium indicum]
MKRIAMTGVLLGACLTPVTGFAASNVTYSKGVVANKTFGYTVKTTDALKKAIQQDKVELVKNKTVNSKYGVVTRSGTFALYYKVKGADQLLVNLNYEPKKFSKKQFDREIGYGTYLGTKGSKTYYYVLPTEAVKGAVGKKAIENLIVKDVPQMMKTFKLQ